MVASGLTFREDLGYAFSSSTCGLVKIVARGDVLINRYG
jgi:hypothetical protein